MACIPATDLWGFLGLRSWSRVSELNPRLDRGTQLRMQKKMLLVPDSRVACSGVCKGHALPRRTACHCPIPIGMDGASLGAEHTANTCRSAFHYDADLSLSRVSLWSVIVKSGV
jgi:hypothetical protein